MSDIWSLLSQRTHPALPLVTYLNSLDGSRTELSAISVANAGAKIANALVMEFDAEPGTRIGLALPWHWQRATWLAGVWSSGCIAVVDEAEMHTCHVIVTDELSCAALIDKGLSDILVVSVHPFGLPITAQLPTGCHDVTIDVRNQPDSLLVGGNFATSTALEIKGSTFSQTELLTRATELAREQNISEGNRVVLVESDLNELDSWIAPLALPLAINGSVLITDLYSPERAAAEGVTARIVS